MALIVSAASGNFNAGATWVGGVVPTVGDEARAATGHTITISANTTCDEISNAGTGAFILSNGITLTANLTAKTTTSGVVLLTYSGNTSAAIVGNITGNTNALQGGTNRCVQHTGSGTLNITGNCSSSGASNSNAVANISNGNINISGNVSAGGTSIQFAGPAVTNTFTGNIFITGNVTASDSANSSSGAVNSSTGTITVIGTITAAQNNAGIQGSSTGPLILTGPFIAANNGRLAVYASFWRWASTIVSSTYFQIPTSNLLSLRNLVTADNITGMPAASDVKSGIAYGPSNELTGTFSQTVTPSTADIATAVWGAATRTITGGLVDTATTLTNSPDVPTEAEIASAVWGAATKEITGGTVTTLTNAPTVPSASAIASQVRSELSVELGRVDQAISSRLAGSAYTAPANSDIAAVKAKTDLLPASPAATGDIPTADITAIKAKTDALVTDRLAQVSTVSTTGAQLAAALS